MRKPNAKIAAMLEGLRGFKAEIEARARTLLVKAFHRLDLARGIDVAAEEEAEVPIIELLSVMITFFIMENYHQLEIENTLSELDLTEASIALFLEIYQRQVIQTGENVQQHVDSSIKFDKVVDVEWKVNKLIATDTLYKANREEYQLKFNIVDTASRPKELEFKMNTEQLTELYQTLLQAVSAIERESNNFIRNV
eukprot:TRINITY_DN130_c0_g1_i1.p1 TRINITY_DN130_c0_g1~~TRINITY_DN130_c0_g1_i1.p1  ORF type:complete len:196 (-),score=64.74 TRINITY_DN130_c0_g1_i1:92-679(-)